MGQTYLVHQKPLLTIQNIGGHGLSEAAGKWRHGVLADGCILSYCRQFGLNVGGGHVGVHQTGYNSTILAYGQVREVNHQRHDLSLQRNAQRLVALPSCRAAEVPSPLAHLPRLRRMVRR